MPPRDLALIKRTIEISQDGAYLSIQNCQLQIRREDEVVGSVPCEDIGVVVVDHPKTTYTHAVLRSLAEADAVLVICGEKHLPVGMLLPLSDHSEIVWRVHDQVSVSRPRLKKLWQQLVRAKIRASALNLSATSPTRKKLLALLPSVKSGDPTNVEAQAARYYWQAWQPADLRFRRDTDGDGANAILNYGYSIMRACVARAIVAAGLIPSLGIRHCHRGNGFALADDLIEPLRAIIDNRVRDLLIRNQLEINREVKASLLGVLAEDVKFGDETGPLMVCMHRYVTSLIRCYRGESKQLLIPELHFESQKTHTGRKDSLLNHEP